MGKRKTAVGFFVLGFLSWATYAGRRGLIARWLRLPRVQYDVVVERGIRIPMPDGVALVADH